MSKARPIAGIPLDRQCSKMDLAVMGGAQHHEVLGLIAAALGAGPNVVHVDERRVATARNRASPTIAQHHLSSHSRRDLLSASIDAPVPTRTHVVVSGSPVAAGMVALSTVL